VSQLYDRVRAVVRRYCNVKTGDHCLQGWESKLRRILQNVNKRRHLGTKNVCFCLYLFLLEMTENQIYVWTRYTIFRFVRYMLLAQLFCKTKVIANLQLEAEQNFYKNVWIRRSSYCFIYLSPSNQLYTRFQSSPSTSKHNFASFTKCPLKRDVYFPRK
jgi:hypothetical protein